MGPYCPIYGVGCILIIILLKRYLNDPIALFIMSIIICSLLEYVTSYLMELLFKARWWDYSDRKFNINGRICLETLVPFGVMCCFMMYILNPMFSKILNMFPETVINVMAVIIAFGFIIDLVVSYTIITKLHISYKKIIEDNTEEITKKVREYIMKKSKFGKRLTKSFPGFKVLKEKYKKNK